MEWPLPRLLNVTRQISDEPQADRALEPCSRGDEALDARPLAQQLDGEARPSKAGRASISLR
jgi:hypothetical protein